MRYFLTGSHGFIGTHLMKRLVREGHEVVSASHEMLYSPESLQNIVTKAQPDYIIHLAAYGNMSHQKDPELIFQANVMATWNLLQATRDIPYKGFINIGSSSEYGRKSAVMSEGDIPETDTFYGASKVAGTYLCKAFSKGYSKPIVTVRPFSVYGPGEAEFRLIPTAIKHMEKGTVMPFVSWPEHDWIYIDDFIEGLLNLVNYVDKSGDSVAGEVVNIGTGIATRNDEIIKVLSYIAEKGIKTEETYKEEPHHSSVWVADTSKLRSLGWRPKVELAEGLKRCWEYERGKYGD